MFFIGDKITRLRVDIEEEFLAFGEKQEDPAADLWNQIINDTELCFNKMDRYKKQTFNVFSFAPAGWEGTHSSSL